MGNADYVHDGASVDYTPGAAVDAGDIVIQGDLVGIAKLDIAASALGALATRGVFDIVKDGEGAVTFAIGDEVYWDAGNTVAVATAAGNTWMGYAVKAATATDTKVRTFLNPGGELPTNAHIADAAAATAAAAALTVSDPDALTAAAAALTASDPTLDASDITDNTGGTPSGSHALADLSDGSTYANDHAALENNLATIAAEYNSLKDDVEANETSLELAIDDGVLQKAELDKLIADVLSIHTNLLLAIDDLALQKAELDKLITDRAANKTTIDALLAALEGLGLLAAS